jgi:hypothetical protein
MNEETLKNIRAVHQRNGFLCEKCGQRSTQVAHGISKGKAGRKAVSLFWKVNYGKDLSEKEIDDIIHHKFNTHASCVRCNDYFNIHISHAEEVKELLERIHEEQR